MPYNTRRKSLSLPSLGIQLPQTSRASTSNHHRSPPSAPSTELPPTKKVKRSHNSTSPSSPRTTKSERPKSGTYEHTPPPSPSPLLDTKIDTEGINDDIVTSVIEQLEKTGNKPHLVKELAAILCNTLDIVGSSANPHAIVSSRLNAYIRRPWTALSPCPLAKELVTTHPRRIYFYLTTSSHQPLPEGDDAQVSNGRRSVISPSISDEEESRKRMVMSPSPEIDLSPPEFDDDDYPPTPAGSFSGRSSLARDGSMVIPVATVHHHNRAASPPLEGDEREFTQTATSMHQKRSMSQDNDAEREGADSVRMTIEGMDGQEDPHIHIPVGDESEENSEQKNSEAAAALFGSHAQPPSINHSHASPVVRPMTAGIQVTPKHFAIKQELFHTDEMDIDGDGKISIMSSTGFAAWGGEMLSPENVELEELDDLLGGF
ncbi:hypothetical protein FGG08_004112 [Glutinoglossum americanum]|uniref:GDS1 winged helix domain-containing protein n=1 Tax=Glutinoglossum americanum TaxID=1670608 RepID=A0A9P8I6D1_9PEZI|nr:hypothetical protein FGG08_004112 [Glutinoglossum americanum]